MTECTDSKARADIGKIQVWLGELAMDYWGPTKTNGRRSELAAVVGDVDDLKTRLAHYIDIDREKTCHGIAEIKRRDEIQSEKTEEESEVKIAKIEAGSKSWVQFLQLAGILAVALIGLLK